MTNESLYKGTGVYHRKITADELNNLDDIFKGKEIKNKELKDEIIIGSRS